MQILNAVEQDTFASPPVFTTAQRRHHFAFPLEVQELAAAWGRALDALIDYAAAGAGGFTPSDLSLAGLGQDEIDELEEEWRNSL